VDLTLASGTWPEATDSLLATLAVPERLAGSAWSAPLDPDARVTPELRPSPRALLLERGGEPVAIHVPLSDGPAPDAVVRVRMGSYGTPLLRVGLGRAPARWTEAVQLSNATRDIELSFALASVLAPQSDVLTLEFSQLSVPALLYTVAVEQGGTTQVLHSPEEWPSDGWGTSKPERVRSLDAPPLRDDSTPRAVVLHSTHDHSILRVGLDARTPAFDFVRMRIGAPGFLRVRACVELAAGADVVGEYVERELLPADGFVDLDVTGLTAAAEDSTLRGLRFEFQVLTADALIRDLELWRRPTLQRLPRPDSPPVHVVVATDSRPALGLAPGVSLAGELPFDPAGQLAWDVALAEGVPPAAGHRVLVEVLAGDEVLAERSTPLTGRWTSHHIALAELRPAPRRAVRVRVTTDHPSGALIANTRVTRGRAQPPRTVLLITSDTHRADHMGYSSLGGVVKTPFLDDLATGGLRFDDATSVTTLTNPSHATMFTGLHLRDTDVLGNLAPLAERADTLAERFEAAGYRTFAAVSARHLLPWRSGFGQGFERLDGPREDMLRDGQETIAAARAMLADAAEHDVFLWLHLFEAHAPYLHHVGITDQYYAGDPYNEKLAELAPAAQAVWDRRIRDARYLLALYKGEVSYLDQLLAGLFRDEPRLESAEIAFTADHGEALGEQQHYWSHSVLLPATLRVPLILRGASLGAPGVISSSASNRHIGRTLLEMAGVPAGDFPGRSLADPVHRDHMASELRYVTGAHGLSAGVLHGQWYLTLYLRADLFGPEPGNALHEAQLFDRVADPACERDLAAAQPELARRLRTALVRWLAQTPPRGGLTGPAPSNSTARADLVALGYAADETSAAQAALFVPQCDCPECQRWR